MSERDKRSFAAKLISESHGTPGLLRGFSRVLGLTVATSARLRYRAFIDRSSGRRLISRRWRRIIRRRVLAAGVSFLIGDRRPVVRALAKHLGSTPSCNCEK